MDDLMIVGDPTEVALFVAFLEKKQWTLGEKGPIRQGAFQYLKRQMEVTEAGITVRADSDRIKELAKLTHVEKLTSRNTPTDHKSQSDEPVDDSGVTTLRSAVGSCCALLLTGQMSSLYRRDWLH